MSQNQTNQRNTLLGVVAILLWSTTIAFSRNLTEQLGTFTAATLIYILAGLIGLLFMLRSPNNLSQLRKLPPLYLFGCGGLFVIYIVALYWSVGNAESRVQVLVIGLINYLWPGLSLVFSIPILKQKARGFLPFGILMALAGIGLATLSTSNISWQTLVQQGGSLGPYILALIAAISWGLYTNLSRRWAEGNDSGAVPIFLLASGLVLGLIRLFVQESSQWSIPTGFSLIYMAAFPGMLAYVLWDLAVRKGNIVLLASLSYLTPLLSTLVSTIVLQVSPGITLWIGAGLVIAGAIICRYSVIESAEAYSE